MSKKAKTSGHTDDVDPEKTPKNEGENPEIATDRSAPQNPGADANPPEAEPETHVDTSNTHATPPSPTVDQRDSTVGPPSPATRSPSPAAKAPSPAKENINPSSPAKDDDVVVTGTAYTALGNPVVLSKHTAKDEFAFMNKGKSKTDLSDYADLSAQDLHSGFLNRLFTSRDYEAGLVNLMKERYEVTT